MKAPFHHWSAAYLSRLAQVAGLGIAAVGGTVFIGWMLDIAVLKSVFPNTVSMKANTALAFVLTGVSLAILAQKHAGHRMRRFAQACAGVVALIGLLTLSQYVFNGNLGLDELLLAEPPGAVATSSPGRMASLSALNFFLGGLSLLLLDTPRTAWIGRVCALTVGLIGLLNLVGYAYGVEPLYGVTTSAHVAVHTAICFVVFSLASFAARPDQGLMTVITSNSAGGMMMRRLLPVTSLGPVVLGALRLAGQRAGLYETEFGVTLSVFFSVVLLSAVALWSTVSLHNMSMSWQRADQALRESESRKAAILLENQANIEYQRLAALNLAQDEMAARERAERAEQELRNLNTKLEQRVQERTAALEVANARTQRDRALIATINESLAQFIQEERSQDVFESLLRNLLKLTASEYGFIDEMWQTPEGEPYLTALAITNIAWDEESRDLYAKFRAGELRWTNVNSLFGAVMTSGKPVIANDAPNDPRRCGIPSGHPPLNRFLGLPLHHGGQLVGIIGLANGPEEFSEQSVTTLEPIVNAAASMIAALKGNRRRQRAEEELQERVVQVQAANKELEAFSYSVSHDLRAPLRGIDGFSRILLEEYAPLLPDDGPRYLRIVRENAQRMGQLIDDLLAFSRLGRQQLQKKSVAPTPLVRAVLADLQEETARRAIEIVVGELPPCQADPALLKQVFVNLLANAFKFTRAQPAARIEIGCRTGDAPGQLTYFVQDNGAGFDMQYAHKLFGVFQRLHRAEDYEGTGVGLAIVQRIIHRLGGRVWAEGAVNQGATFYFTLSQGVES